jgi:hypothetical protein
MSIEITVTAVRPTTHGVRDGIDVDLTVDGIAGGATVAPDEVNGGFAVYGNDVSMWLSGKLVQAFGDDRTALREIAAHACEAAAERT